MFESATPVHQLAHPPDFAKAVVKNADGNESRAGEHSFMARLKQATDASHRSIERRLPVLDPQLTWLEYRRLLGRFYGFYNALEARLLALPCWDEIGLDYGPRRKTPQLQQDLLYLGETAQSLLGLAQCTELPALGNVRQALGCLYVIEGATLGGQIITRHLLANLWLRPADGTAFFHGYGAQTGANWRAFCAAATGFEQRHGGGAEIIRSANDSFAALESWLFRPQPDSSARQP